MDVATPPTAKKRKRDQVALASLVANNLDQYLTSRRKAPPGVRQWVLQQLKSNLETRACKGVFVAFTIGTSGSNVPFVKSAENISDWIAAFTGQIPLEISKTPSLGLKAPDSYVAYFDANPADGMAPALRNLSDSSGTAVLMDGAVASWAKVLHFEDQIVHDTPNTVRVHAELRGVPLDDEAARSVAERVLTGMGASKPKMRRKVHNGMRMSTFNLEVPVDMSLGVPSKAGP